jgi:hypothetical protein
MINGVNKKTTVAASFHFHLRIDKFGPCYLANVDHDGHRNVYAAQIAK